MRQILLCSVYKAITGIVKSKEAILGMAYLGFMSILLEGLLLLSSTATIFLFLNYVNVCLVLLV